MMICTFSNDWSKFDFLYFFFAFSGIIYLDKSNQQNNPVKLPLNNKTKLSLFVYILKYRKVKNILKNSKRIVLKKQSNVCRGKNLYKNHC